MIWAGYGLGALLAPTFNIGASAFPTGLVGATAPVSTAGKTTSYTMSAMKPIVSQSQLFAAATGQAAQDSALAALFLKNAAPTGTRVAPTAPTAPRVDPSNLMIGGATKAALDAAKQSPVGNMMAQAAAQQRQAGSSSAAAATSGGVAQACAQAGGRWDGAGCTLADGSKIGINANGEEYCMNAVGQCAGAASAAGGGMGSAMMIGAAALAALFFLK